MLEPAVQGAFVAAAAVAASLFAIGLLMPARVHEVEVR